MTEILIRKPTRVRRRRFQRGSLQKRKSGGCWNWIVFWWEDRRRRSQVLGSCSTISRPEALAEMAKLLLSANAHAGKALPHVWTVGEWIRDAFLPFIRQKWKLSTASTSGDRIRKHIVTDLGALELQSVTRDLLQQYLERKVAAGLSFSVVDHLRWDFRAVFRLAVHDRVIPSNPAEMLFTPPTTSRPCRCVPIRYSGAGDPERVRSP